MERFIRLDQKGTWRGRDHRSSFAHDPADEENTPWESGVSCYSLKNVGWAVNGYLKLDIGSSQPST